MTVLLGEHRLERCLAAADRVVALDRGTVLYDGGPDGFGRAALRDGAELATPVTRLFDLAGIDASPVTVKEARARLGAGPPPAPAAARRRRPGRRPSGATTLCAAAASGSSCSAGDGAARGPARDRPRRRAAASGSR